MMQVIISGYVRQSHNTVTSEIDIGPQGYFTGSGCLKSGSVKYVAATYFPCNDRLKMADTSVITALGPGKAYIGPGYGSMCGIPGGSVRCYTYSGQRTYTLRIPRPVAFLSASRTTVDPAADPDTVRFTLDWQQKTIGNSVIPVTITAWRWKSDSTGQTTNVTCRYPYRANTCNVSVTASGTMSVDVRLNGRDTTVTERVNVVPCPTGHPLLDNMYLRKKYVDLHTESLNRLKETPFVVIQSGSNYRMESFPENSDTQCRTGVPHPATLDSSGFVQPGEKVVAIGHTHLYAPGVKYPCPGEPGGSAKTPLGAGGRGLACA